MNNKRTKKSAKAETCSCFCQEAGIMLNEFMSKLGPPEAAREHFDAARVEFLKGLRALLDARIEHFSKRKARGEKINVE